MKTIEFKEDEIIVDGIKYTKDYETKQEPEFKYWAKWSETEELFFITKRTNKALWGKFPEYKQEQFINITECIVPTPAEIESHLRKICDEKGFKRGIKYKDVSYGEIVTIVKNPKYTYFETCDVLAIEGIDPTPYDIVYELGKFAEIIPDKKKLPKAKIEFVKFLKDYNIELKDCDDEFTINKFLNQYED